MARIVILTHEFPPFRGGIATYVRSIAESAARLGHAVKVIAPDYGGNSAEDLNLPFEVIRFPGGKYSPRDLPKLLARIWKIVGTSEYDYLYAADWPHISTLSLINRFRPAPFYAIAHGTEAASLRSSKQSRFLFAQRAFLQATGVVANSHFTKGLVLSNTPGLSEDRVTVAPLGVDDFWKEHVAEDPTLRDRFGIAPHHRMIITVARLERRKGHLTVLKALSHLPADLDDLCYVIVGQDHDGEYKEQLESVAASSKIPVKFAGPVSKEDLRQFYRQAEIFCMPGAKIEGKVEGFGLAYLEAAAQGTPAVARAIDALPEVVVDGVTGVLLAPNDDEVALGKILTELLRSPQHIELMSTAAIRHSLAFSWDNCAALTFAAAKE